MKLLLFLSMMLWPSMLAAAEWTYQIVAKQGTFEGVKFEGIENTTVSCNYIWVNGKAVTNPSGTSTYTIKFRLTTADGKTLLFLRDDLITVWANHSSGRRIETNYVYRGN